MGTACEVRPPATGAARTHHLDLIEWVHDTVDLKEVEVAVVRDVGLDVGEGGGDREAGAGALGSEEIVEPMALARTRRPLVRVAAVQVGDRRRREARVALEDGGRGDGRGLDDRACLADDLIGQVGALAVDDSVARAMEDCGLLAALAALAALANPLVGDDARRLRAAHHRHLDHEAQKVLHPAGARLREEQHTKVAAEEPVARSLGGQQVRLYRLARSDGAAQGHRREEELVQQAHARQRRLLVADAGAGASTNTGTGASAARRNEGGERGERDRGRPTGVADERGLAFGRTARDGHTRSRAMQIELLARVPHRRRACHMRQLVQPEREPASSAHRGDQPGSLHEPRLGRRRVHVRAKNSGGRWVGTAEAAR